MFKMFDLQQIKNKIEKFYAEKELILSGGSINSPQLLMLSGIGDANHLKEKGINVVHDLKGVGKNLQDHLETYIQQECKTPDSLYIYKISSESTCWYSMVFI